jgi:branched-chain amino acid transport system ATP-binding protein
MGSVDVELEGTDLLCVSGVSQRFGGVTALDRVDLTVAPGEVHGLIGPNGAGKTTLFDCITGVRRPSAGKVLLDGRDITSTSSVQRARLGVRRTFQRQQVFGWLSVEDNVVLALDSDGGGGGVIGDLLRLPGRTRRERERREQVEVVLERCGLIGVRTEPAGGLSIGQLRSVELARAIISKPRLLLLDEPTSGLEERETEQLAQIVADMRDEAASGILLVEHHIPFVMGLATRMTVLELGRVIASGTPEEVRANELVQNAYLT